MHTVASITLVIAAFLVAISAVQPIAARLHVPFTVLLAGVGVGVGVVSTFLVDHLRLAPVLDIARPLADFPISAPVFLVVFLPLLLFHAALTIDLREIARDVGPILTLAILAVFAAAAAIGLGLSFAGVPLAVGLLLGAIVATTDPAAVIAIFRELGAPPRLTRLLEGESLLNDAAAIVLFGMLVAMLADGVQSSIADAVLAFVTTSTSLGGPNRMLNPATSMPNRTIAAPAPMRILARRDSDVPSTASCVVTGPLCQRASR